jgi:hypothetical protein
VPAAAPTAVVELIEFSPTLQSKENYFSCYDGILIGFYIPSDNRHIVRWGRQTSPQPAYPFVRRSKKARYCRAF